ncbi:MAG: epimerase, partial [Bacillati bacterium ANGP1]
MRTLISAASGLIGSAVSAALSADGHTVVRLVRRSPGAGE